MAVVVVAIAVAEAVVTLIVGLLFFLHRVVALTLPVSVVSVCVPYIHNFFLFSFLQLIIAACSVKSVQPS